MYYFTGDQLQLAVLKDAEDSDKRDQLLMLGGQVCAPADFADATKRTAFVYLKCPWNTCSQQEKSLPLPCDLLTSPLQIIIEFNPASSIFVQATGASALPTQFASAEAIYVQTHLANSADLLARRVNMNENCLSYPLRYFQQTTFRTQVKVEASDVANNVAKGINLTGFRSGSLKSIDIWAIKTANMTNGKMNQWELLKSVNLKVNGLVYYNAPATSHQIFSIINRKTSASFAGSFVDNSGSSITAPVPATGYWVEVPFAQPIENECYGTDVNTGLSLQNSVINLDLGFMSEGDYTICCSYNYVANLLFSRGGAEYVF